MFYKLKIPIGLTNDNYKFITNYKIIVLQRKNNDGCGKKTAENILRFYFVLLYNKLYNRFFTGSTAPEVRSVDNAWGSNPCPGTNSCVTLSALLKFTFLLLLTPVK